MRGFTGPGGTNIRSDDRPDIFVTRVAGNIVTPEIIGSLEYGVAVLGLKVIVVLGHTSCGAVKAAIKGDKSRSDQVLYQGLHAEYRNQVEMSLEHN